MQKPNGSASTVAANGVLSGDTNGSDDVFGSNPNSPLNPINTSLGGSSGGQQRPNAQMTTGLAQNLVKMRNQYDKVITTENQLQVC